MEDNMTSSEQIRSVPQLRFPEFEGVWVEKKLGEILSFKNGVNAPKEKYGKGYKFINVLDIIENDFITHERIKGSVDVSEDVFLKNIVEYGDILFQRSSETREEVGQSNVYLDKNKPAIFGGFIIRGNKVEDYYPSFMNYLLKTSSSRKEITTKSGGSTRYNVGQETLSKVKIITTGIPEQTKIANFLTAVDKRINLLQKKKAELEQYKKGIMQVVFSGEFSVVSGKRKFIPPKIRFKKDDGSDFPDWEEKKLGEVATFRRGSFPQPYGLPKWYDDKNGIPFVQVYDVDNNFKLKSTTKQKISELAMPKSVFVKKGSIVITIQGSIGRIAITQYDAYVDRTLLIFQSFTKPVDKLFFTYIVYLLFMIEKQRAVGGTIKTITKEKLSAFSISLPCIDEQKKIANFLSSIDKSIEKLGSQIDNSQLFKKGLLQKLFV